MLPYVKGFLGLSHILTDDLAMTMAVLRKATLGTNVEQYLKKPGRQAKDDRETYFIGHF